MWNQIITYILADYGIMKDKGIWGTCIENSVTLGWEVMLKIKHSLCNSDPFSTCRY